MKEFYEIHVAGLTRQLPICPLNDKLSIAGFVIFGDPDLTCACARDLLKIAPAHDVIITAESKGIPLAHEMARQAGEHRYLLARKATKLYMKNVFGVEVDSITTELYMRDIFSVSVHSITTAKEQKLYLDGADAEFMRGRNVLIVDDVISTGESLKALEKLVTEAGGNIVGRMAILAEGDACERKDIQFLQKLPLFHPDGTEI